MLFVAFQYALSLIFVILITAISSYVYLCVHLVWDSVFIPVRDVSAILFSKVFSVLFSLLFMDTVT